MDFKKIIKAALIPTVALVVLGVIGVVLGFVLSSVPFVPLLVGLGFFVVDCLIMVYAGYAAVKNSKLDLVSAALVGALAAFIAGIINGIISLVLMVVGVYSIAGSTAGAIGGATALVIGIVGLIIGVFINLVIGAVLGAIGGFIGQKM